MAMGRTLWGWARPSSAAVTDAPARERALAEEERVAAVEQRQRRRQEEVRVVEWEDWRGPLEEKIFRTPWACLW